MGPRSTKGKRKREPAKSGSDDEDYGKPKRSKRGKSSRAQTKKPAKNRRRKAVTDESEDIESGESDLDEESLDELVDEQEHEQVEEFHESSGRPKRRSTVQKTYVMSDSDDEVMDEDSKSRAVGKTQKTQVVKLKVPLARLDISSTARTTRAGSRPQSRRGYSAEPQSAGTRRSTRLHHNEDEAMVALTNSGHHVEVVREPTRSPDITSGRRTRGGKGYKGPSTSAIFEEGEEASRSQPADPEEAEAGAVQAQEAEEQATATDEHMPSVEDSQPDPDVLHAESQKPVEGDAEMEDVAAVQEKPDEPESTEIIYEKNGDEEAGNDDEDEAEDEDEAPVPRPRRSTARVCYISSLTQAVAVLMVCIENLAGCRVPSTPSKLA